MSKFDKLRDGLQIRNCALNLFYTSVQDMQSSLSAYDSFEDIKVLELVRLFSVERKEKTREKYVLIKINKILRDAGLKVRRESC